VSGSLIDAYIKALSELEEFAFQRAIVQRLLVALNNFQSVPTYPRAMGRSTGTLTRALRDTAATG
jgi:hypothetical protein